MSLRLDAAHDRRPLGGTDRRHPASLLASCTTGHLVRTVDRADRRLARVWRRSRWPGRRNQQRVAHLGRGKQTRPSFDSWPTGVRKPPSMVCIAATDSRRVGTRITSRAIGEARRTSSLPCAARRRSCRAHATCWSLPHGPTPRPTCCRVDLSYACRRHPRTSPVLPERIDERHQAKISRSASPLAPISRRLVARTSLRRLAGSPNRSGRTGTPCEAPRRSRPQSRHAVQSSAATWSAHRR
jgi:hypothetical protein